MKKLLIPALLVISGVAISTHTSVEAMQEQQNLSKVEIKNISNAPISVTYKKAQDQKLTVKTLDKGGSLEIQKEEGNPIETVSLQLLGEFPSEAKDLTKEEIRLATQASASIFVYAELTKGHKDVVGYMINA